MNIILVDFNCYFAPFFDTDTGTRIIILGKQIRHLDSDSKGISPQNPGPSEFKNQNELRYLITSGTNNLELHRKSYFPEDPSFKNDAPSPKWWRISHGKSLSEMMSILVDHIFIDIKLLKLSTVKPSDHLCLYMKLLIGSLYGENDADLVPSYASKLIFFGGCVIALGKQPNEFSIPACYQV